MTLVHLPTANIGFLDSLMQTRLELRLTALLANGQKIRFLSVLLGLLFFYLYGAPVLWTFNLFLLGMVTIPSIYSIYATNYIGPDISILYKNTYESSVLSLIVSTYRL